MITGSFQGVRTIAETPSYGAIACNCESTPKTSLGACSISSTMQSKPAPAITSVEKLLQSEFQMPSCGRPARRAALKWFRGISN